MWNELAKTALLGTNNQPLPRVTENLKALLKDTADAESALLAAAGTLALQQTAGHMPAKFEGDLPPVADVPVLPLCNDEAEQLLALLLTDTMNRAHSELLLGNWVRGAYGASQRVPDEFIPLVFERAASAGLPTEQVAAVSDARGQWLAGQSPNWSVFNQHGGIPNWLQGKLTDRRIALRAWRQSDPTAARDALASHRDKEKASAYAGFIGCLDVNLSMDDEPLLESLLDDSSKQVREAAADLLVRLKDSRYVTRMTDRLRGRIRIEKKKSKQVVVVDLVDDLDDAMIRDTVERSSKTATRQKANWFSMMLRAVPPSFWSAELNTDPETLLHQAENGDWNGLLRSSWQLAILNHRDHEWALADVKHSLTRDFSASVSGLARLLPEAERESLLTEQAKKDSAVLLHAGLICTYDWSLDLSRTVIAFISENRADKRQQWRIHAALDEFVRYMNPAAYQDAQATLSGEKSNHYLNKKIDEFLQILGLRARIAAAFGQIHSS